MEANSQVIFATAVFLITYAIIISEKIHRAVIVLLGAMVIILGGVLHQEKAVEAVYHNQMVFLKGVIVQSMAIPYEFKLPPHLMMQREQ